MQFAFILLCTLSICYGSIQGPNQDTIWAVYHEGCIEWDSSQLDLAADSTASFSVETGTDFATSTSIASNVNLQNERIQWIVHGVNPSDGRVRMTLDTTNTEFVSETFVIEPPHSEVEVQGSTYSWAQWFPIRLSACKTFVGANPCGIEGDMWTMVHALLSPANTVLELGARYGTTSCAIAVATNNSGRVVSVEPHRVRFRGP